MKVAVTGVSGYLGQLLARRLGAEPGVDSILGLDLAPPSAPIPKLAFERADVRTAPFSDLFAGVDVVFHLAFVVSPPRKMSLADVEAINVGGSARVFDGALRAGVRTIVYASSVAAYGSHADNPPLLVEESPLRPNAGWYYSRTKGEVERMLDALERDHPEAVVVRLRPDVFLGPSVNNPVGAMFSRRVLASFRRTMMLSVSWVDDTVEGFVLASRLGRSDAFNLCGDAPMSLDAIGALLGRRVIHVDERWALPAIRLAARARLVSPLFVDWLDEGSRAPILASSEKAKRVLGWKPRFDTAGALRELVRAMGASGERS
jgi:nucleoside-diphosphate-sugar epimerase